MAEYRLVFNFGEGSGRIDINGTLYQRGDIYIEEGTTINFEVFPDEGFTFGQAIFNNLLISAGTNPFSWPMPERDSRLIINLSGIPTPTSEYELRYFSEFCDITGKDVRIEILEWAFLGTAERKKVGSMNFRFGQIGSDQFQTFVNTSFDFGLYGTASEFVDMLEGDNRKFQVKIYIDLELFWVGYLNNSIFNWNLDGSNQLIKFTASDGLVALEAIRMVESYFRAFAGQKAIGPIVSGLNQSFVDKRPVNIACRTYETRMDRNVGLFEQFLWPEAAIFTDGEQPQYLGDGGIIQNTSVTIKEGITNLVKPFFGRVMLWKDEFYVIALPELRYGVYELFRYDAEANYVETSTIATNGDIGCKTSQGQASALTVFTEFTATLELGLVDIASRGGVYEVGFVLDDFAIGSPTSPYPGIPFLARWEYIRAIPSGQPASYPTAANPALIQYANDSFGERVKIWGTTSNAGLSDTNISYIELNQNRTGAGIPVIQETANKISFKIEYICEAADTGAPIQPTLQNCGIMIRIGDSWLDYSAPDTFTWVGSETIMEFPFGRLNAWNTLEIQDVVVPETGEFTIRLYEVINTGTADNHAVAFRNMSIKIEENDAVSLAAISSKAITSTQYSRVFDEYKIKIGDAQTANSTSAIKLDITDTPVSTTWSRDGVEEKSLLEIIVRELANFRGTLNPRYVMTLVRDGNNDPFDLYPYKSLVFEGYLWMINAMEIDLFRNLWKIEIIRLAQIESLGMDELAYEL